MTLNLVNDPWIEVLDKAKNKPQLISIKTLFEHAEQYQRLAGETDAQDLAVLRWLEAILVTVYSRVNADGEPYEWLTDDGQLDPDFEPEDCREDLIDTWLALQEREKFGQPVLDYLKQHQAEFDFDQPNGLYQVSLDEYNALVPTKKRLTEEKINSANVGTVLIKQINRRVSESGHTPALFAQKKGSRYLNEISRPELVRWLLAYQSFAGTSDKVKTIPCDQGKAGISRGWLYQLDPVYIERDNLFETLLFNLVLVVDESQWSPIQKPAWEEHDKVAWIQRLTPTYYPDNLAELFTLPSRILYIPWGRPYLQIYQAGTPNLSPENFYLEPMTTWHARQKSRRAPITYLPNTIRKETMYRRMWQNFGTYIPTNDGGRQPGIWNWLNNTLKNDHASLPDQIRIVNANLVSDGNATSNMPVADYSDQLSLRPEFIMDPSVATKWLPRIEITLSEINELVDHSYYGLLKTWADLQSIDTRKNTGILNVKKIMMYQRLDGPLKVWLQELKATNLQDNIATGKRIAGQIILQSIKLDLDRQINPRLWTRKIDGEEKSYFMARQIFARKVRHQMGLVQNQEEE